MMQLHLLDDPVDRVEGEVAVALFFLDERPPTGPAAILDWRLNGRLTEQILQGKVSGRSGDHLLVRSNGKIAADWALFVGGGRHRGLGENDCRELLRHLLATCRRAGFSRIALGLELPAGMNAVGLQKIVHDTLEEMAPGNLVCLLNIVDDAVRLV
jgi:GNAT superfamily N-acetyltransferase